MQHVKTKIIAIRRGKLDDSEIFPAAEAIKQGKVVVFPTETVYGVGCRFDDEAAKERIFALKKRDHSKPLGIYLLSFEEVKKHAIVPPSAEKLAREFLPGPLTLVLPGKIGRRLGFRIPSDEVTRRLIFLAGTPLAGTSANLSGQESPVTGEEAIAAMNGRVDVIMDAGRTELGRESTVIDLCGDEPVLIREGVIPVDVLSKILSREVRKAF